MRHLQRKVGDQAPAAHVLRTPAQDLPFDGPAIMGSATTPACRPRRR
jgi:hypothetical protein